MEGWIPPATPSGSIGGRTPPPTVRSEGLCSPAFRKVGSLWNLDKQLGVLHRRHSHWPGRKRSVVRTTACLAIWLLKTTATRNRCRFQILFKSVNRQILLRKSFNNSTMIISHPFLPYRFHCLNQNCEKLILRGKILRDTPFESHRSWSNLDSACRTRGQIDIIHRNLHGKPQHILGSLPCRQQLSIISPGNRFHQLPHFRIEYAKTRLDRLIIYSHCKTAQQALFRKFRQDSADKDIVSSFCEVGHKEQGICLASLYLLFYVINYIHFPDRKFLQKFLPARVMNYIINLGNDAGVYTKNPVARWASE